MSIKIDITACRVCLKTEDVSPICSDSETARMFHFCTQLQISENNDLPKALCNKCADRLKIAYDFRKQAEATENHLKLVLAHFIKELKRSVHAKQFLDEQLYNSTDLDNSVTQSNNSMKENESAVAIKIEVKQRNQSEIQADNYQNSNEKISVFHCSYGEKKITEIDPLEMVPEQKNDNDECGTQTDLCSVNNDELDDTNLYSCSRCGKGFSHGSNLLRHLKIHDKIRPFKCSICEARFTENESLKRHFRIHSGERPFMCYVCGRGFTQSKSLTFHMRRHTGEKPHCCDTCGLSFRIKDGLKRHIMVKHSNLEMKKYPCSICDKLLYSKYTLQNHMEKHKSK